MTDEQLPTASASSSAEKTNGRAPLNARVTLLGLDGERAVYITPAEAAKRLGLLTPRVVQNACRAWWKRISAERKQGGDVAYAAGPRELRCYRFGSGERGWFYVREDTLDSLEFKRREMKGQPGVWGRVAGTPSRTYRPRPTSKTATKSSAKTSAKTEPSK